MARSRNIDEKLDDNSLDRVITYLESKGSTKKNACSMLNIAYNTSRLDKLINEYKQKKEDEARRRSEKRGKPATPEETAYIISEYLSGEPLEGISKSTYRGTAFIRSILERYAVPERRRSPNYFTPNLIPDEATRVRFNTGELVYSARYDTLAEIRSEKEQKGVYVYLIWLRGNWQQFAYQPAYELASLDSIKSLGVSL
jgi:hypothetical protein